MRVHEIDVPGAIVKIRSHNSNRCVNEIMFVGTFSDDASMWFSWMEQGVTYTLKLPFYQQKLTLKVQE